MNPDPNSLVSRIWHVLRAYYAKVLLFRPNARLYLLNTIISGLSFGIFNLLFNFYALSLGYDEILVGQLLTTSSMMALVGALPAGFLSDRIGRNSSLILSNITLLVTVLGMTVWRSSEGLFLMNALHGLGQSLKWVTTSPFLMENSGEEERTYLFAMSFGILTTASFAGNWIGGRMPTWLGGLIGVAATNTEAYGWSIASTGLVSLLGLIPLVLIKPQYALKQPGEDTISPFQYTRQNPALLAKLISPWLITSLGAGLLMPFMNIFYRTVHHQSDVGIGSLFGWGALAVGIGSLLAPPLADRWGKIRIVVISQALSIPFLILLGFTPWFWLSAIAYLIRNLLMNMGAPVYDTFVMEHIKPEARATVASLISMSWNFGWALGPTVSGWLQVRHGFDPVFLGTITTYTIAILLYWRFFWHESEPQPSIPSEA